MKTNDIEIRLSKGQYKLLLSLIEETIEQRSNCGCNSVCENELKMLSSDEKMAALQHNKVLFKEIKEDWEEHTISGKSFEQCVSEGYGCMDITFAEWLLSEIKKQRRTNGRK